MLPVHKILPELKASLAENKITLLSAPPGSGKTTILPPALLDEPWLAGKKILMLEPRRLATKAAALRISELENSAPGKLCGYRVKDDTKTSPDTKIEIITEAILSRMLQQDPELNQAGLIIFDEFHERSLNSDLALALTLESRKLFREDLRILIMSATLNTRELENKIQDTRHVASDGYLYPVEINHRPPLYAELAKNIYETLKEAQIKSRGSILVFLPGRSEIERCEREISSFCAQNSLEIHKLHGQISLEQQNNIIRSGNSKKRSVILATNLAESSVTIDGVSTVIDAGLEKIPKQNNSTGLSTLETVRISLDSAEQRAGRAGRTGPGICYRIWSSQEEPKMRKHRSPEILNADLSEMALHLFAWGTEPEQMTFLDSPPEHAMKSATSLLCQLDATDENRNITETGRKMVELPFHPRLSRFILEAKNDTERFAVHAIANLLSEGDLFPNRSADSSLFYRTKILFDLANRGFSAQNESMQTHTVNRILNSLKRRHIQPAGNRTPEEERVAEMLALAFPDRLTRKRDNQPCLFQSTSGDAFSIHPEDPLANSTFLIVAAATANKNENRITLSLPISQEMVYRLFVKKIQERERFVETNDGSFLVEKTEFLGSIPLRIIRNKPDKNASTRALLDYIKTKGEQAFQLDEPTKKYIRRYQFYKNFIAPESKPFCESDLYTKPEETLQGWIETIQSPAELKRLPFLDLVQSYTGYPIAQKINEMLPEKITMTNGRVLTIQYSDTKPVASARIQDLFGVKTTPLLPGSSIPVLLELLSPARRPIQITDDLRGFWDRTYAEVRKELRGRYPKHSWPEDPASATPPEPWKGRKRNYRVE